ncbi:epsilon-sarcoglycan isoform X2 [Zootermopsis nevadensis]|uniref:Epsilon-sarcoglycan n=1 Tax=Zootermopsis nevadensis TaxID=136037 RepID=A0A067R2I8_ZOONE|nr:epsilon-sarcoglycan isoform X2 [Zootermopsis nevadensis]KDR16217.1 Epsilon-sarcoglycan [Zootermopsis nevadensis]
MYGVTLPTKKLLFSFIVPFQWFWNFGIAENVHMTKVFILPIEPGMFNWTLQGVSHQFSYRPSLLNAPDLPPWIHYVYSDRHQTGFLYGVPPQQHGDLELEIVGLNRDNYETRRRVVQINVQEKPDPAKYEVQMKVDNLNVEDMFDSYRLNRLLDIFRCELWRESEGDLYVTFLASAVHLGARHPLRPNEGEGVVLRIGSTAEFSTALVKLQDEVKPLWRLNSCPRDFKRTTEERLFRDKGFVLDWCAFRLVEASSSSLHQHFPIGPDSEVSVDQRPLSLGHEDLWTRPSKSQVPQRSYVREFVYTIMIPMLVMIILVLILSLILCFHHEGISKRNKETPAVQMVQYTAVHRATNTLRSLSSQRRVLNPPSDQCSTTVSRSHTASPNSSLPRTSTPRMSMECNTYYRPNPPPYAGPTHSRADF